MADSQFVDIYVTFSHMFEEYLFFFKMNLCHTIHHIPNYTVIQSYHIHITLYPSLNKSDFSGLFLPTHINLEQIPDADNVIKTTSSSASRVFHAKAHCHFIRLL